MTRRRRELDTLAVVRGMGARAVAAATLRRLSSRAGLWWRRGGAALDPDMLQAALRVMPSPLAECDDAARLATLGPDAREAILRRAWGAAHKGEQARAEGDPRLAWEPDRLTRLVVIAAGVRAAEGEEEEALRSAFERVALAWIDANPPGETSAWLSPLEVGIRAWNLWVATAMARVTWLSEPAARAIAESLHAHGRSLDARLEDDGLVVGSHLVGELVGLGACGAALQMAGGEPCAWLRRARARLAREAERQVLADGGGAEASSGYGRFVAELWLAALVTARSLGDPPPAAVARAARAMLDHLTAALAPDGGGLGIGDDDDSRVLPPAAREHRVMTLVPLAAALCGAPERPQGVPWSEEAAWLAGTDGWIRFRAAGERPWAASVAMRDFGVYLGRRGGLGGDLVTLRAGGNGQRGAGGHAHNDPLTVTVWLDGAPVVIDPGTGVYLGRRALRDRFRGVAAHATVCVDGLEPSPILRSRPFALPDRARARLLELGDTLGSWWCAARHDGYRSSGVTVRREVRLDRDTGVVTVVDDLSSKGGEHEVCLSFPVAGDAAVEGDAVRVGAPGAPVAWLRGDPYDGLTWRIDPAPVSPEYGVISPGVVVRRAGRVRVPARIVTIVSRQTRTHSHGPA